MGVKCNLRLFNFSFVAETSRSYSTHACCDSVDFANFVAATGRTKSNRLDLIRQVAATNFRREDNIVYQKYLVRTRKMALRQVAGTSR